MLLGSALAQVLIAIGGVDTALIGLGAFFAVLLVLTLRSLRVADDTADIPIVAIGLLRRIPPSPRSRLWRWRPWRGLQPRSRSRPTRW